MAGDWVAACKDLPNKPEVIALSNAIHLDRMSVAAFLVWGFWSWADSQTSDGVITGVTVANLVEMFNKPENFWLTMQQVGWLTVEPTKIVIPKFIRWMGKSAKQRLSKNVRQSRWRSPDEQEEGVGAFVGAVAPTTEQNRTEQRGMNSPLTPSCPEPPKAARGPKAAPKEAVASATTKGDQDRGGLAPPDPAGATVGQCPETAKETDPVVLTFPTVGKGAKEWALREGKLAEYAEAFPGLDVRLQARKALQWCRDNPAKRKTPRGMPAFLWRWFERAQNSNPRAASSGGTAQRSESVSERIARLRKEQSCPTGTKNG